MVSDLKRNVYLVLDPTEGSTKWDKFFNSLLVALIIINTIAVILETVESIYISCRYAFLIVEYFSVAVFSVEYVLRVWTCTLKPPYQHPVTGRLSYIFSLSGIIDLLAILPFYFPLVFKVDLRAVRMLRILRFFRFFKLGRYLNASKVITNVFKEKKAELVLSFVIIMFLVIVASSIMYYAEHEAQPGRFSSIPETMWWSVATLTTVGYGDMYPVTGIGKFLTACIAILGIGMFALPAGILASGFSDEFKRMNTSKNICPHCGNEIGSY